MLFILIYINVNIVTEGVFVPCAENVGWFQSGDVGSGRIRGRKLLVTAGRRQTTP